MLLLLSEQHCAKWWAFLMPAKSQFAEHALSKRLDVLGNSR
ncbi:MAG: hypothetical protein PHG15_15080 [Acinetobacter sp.]|nr:hypothetical protein [Acinetobacter sp.]MDD2947060.1 hypothetical protein [Acinetobacter sp.]